MRKFLVLIVISSVLFLTGCKSDPIPKNAISSDEFVNILVDVHIAEGIYLERKRIKIDSLESTSLYLAVLDEHNVTEEQMLTTTLYYSRHPKEYKKIYDEVLEKISLKIEDVDTRSDAKIDIDSKPIIKKDKLKK